MVGLRINKQKLTRWIDSFSDSFEKTADRHIDMFVKGICTNKNWINIALLLQTIACEHIQAKCYKCNVMISFSLNVIKGKGIIPKRLSNRIINKSNTPPIIHICRGNPQDYLFPESKVVNHLRSQYNMTVYYYEEYEDVTYRCLFYIPNKPSNLMASTSSIST